MYVCPEEIVSHPKDLLSKCLKLSSKTGEFNLLFRISILILLCNITLCLLNISKLHADTQWYTIVQLRSWNFIEKQINFNSFLHNNEYSQLYFTYLFLLSCCWCFIWSASNFASFVRLVHQQNVFVTGRHPKYC